MKVINNLFLWITILFFSYGYSQELEERFVQTKKIEDSGVNQIRNHNSLKTINLNVAAVLIDPNKEEEEIVYQNSLKPEAGLSESGNRREEQTTSARLITNDRVQILNTVQVNDTSYKSKTQKQVEIKLKAKLIH
jgi:hypothetical protein